MFVQPRRTTPPTSASPLTPSGSIIVSVTTPHGSGSTEKRTLGTEASEVSAVTDQRHLAHDFDKLVHEMNTFNLARGLEHQGLVNDVRTLKNEVRGLAGLVRMRQSVATPAVLMVPQSHARRVLPPTVLAATNQAGEEKPRRVTLDAVDRAVGGSSPISSVPPNEYARAIVELDVPPPLPTPSRSTSEAHSYLSSHHSDDDILHIEEELLLPPIHSPLWPAADGNTRDPLSLQVSPDSSSLSSSSYASSSELSERWLENDPVTLPSHLQEVPRLPEVVERALADIKDQLRVLDDNQNANGNLLESLQRDRDPDEDDRQTSELLERLGHIEDLLRTYLQQAQQQQKKDSSPVGRRTGFDQVPVPPQQRLSVSSSDSGDSLQRLRGFLDHLTNQDNHYDYTTRNRMSMPPLPTTSAPSMSRQPVNDPLDINISPPQPLPVSQSEVPHIEPFNFLYGDSIIGRGERPRSVSPLSVDKLPTLRHVASVVLLSRFQFPW